MVWRWIVGILLGGASAGAVASAADANDVGRVAGVFAAAFLVLVAVNVLREQVWAYGCAFLLGICWFWAVVALAVAGSLRSGEVIGWLAWSVIVVVGSVRSRDAGEGLHP
jgi:hypothetical protein